MTWTRSKKLAAAAATLAAVIGGGGMWAAAASPTRPAVVYACYSTSTGALRVVGATSPCHSGEKHIRWRQEGQHGLRGAPGTPGTPGTDGTDGKTVLNGSGAPDSSVGANGDFYLDTSAEKMYGPKAAGAWPGSGVSLVGPAAASTSNFEITNMANINSPGEWTSSAQEQIDNGNYLLYVACGFGDQAWVGIQGEDDGPSGTLAVVGASVPVTSSDPGQDRIDLPLGTSLITAQVIDPATNLAVTITASASFDDVADTCTSMVAFQ